MSPLNNRTWLWLVSRSNRATATALSAKTRDHWARGRLVMSTVARVSQEPAEPVHWLLLTTLDVDDLEQSAPCVRWYAADRTAAPRSEERCQTEKLQLEDASRILRALAIYCIVAWRLLHHLRGTGATRSPVHSDADPGRVAGTVVPALSHLGPARHVAGRTDGCADADGRAPERCPGSRERRRARGEGALVRLPPSGRRRGGLARLPTWRLIPMQCRQPLLA